jgi:hypothetical protein
MEYIAIGARVYETLHSPFCEENNTKAKLQYMPTEHCTLCKAYYAGYDQGYYDSNKKHAS